MEAAKVKPLTKRQQEVLGFIESFISQNGYSPSTRQIAKGLDLQSPSTAHEFVRKLESAGFVKTDPKLPRSLKIVGFEWNIEKLREEIAELRAENAELKQRLSQKEDADARHDALDHVDL